MDGSNDPTATPGAAGGPGNADEPQPRSGGRVPGGTFVWPAPASSTVGRRWPYAKDWSATDPAHVAGLEWPQDLSSTDRSERLARKWSRDKLAAEAGVSHNAVKDFESGLRWPSWQTLATLCHALDLVVAVEHQRHVTRPATSLSVPSTTRERQ